MMEGVYFYLRYQNTPLGESEQWLLSLQVMAEFNMHIIQIPPQLRQILRPLYIALGNVWLIKFPSYVT